MGYAVDDEGSERRMDDEAKYGGSSAVATLLVRRDGIDPDGRFTFFCPGNANYIFSVGKQRYQSKDLDPRRHPTRGPHQIFFDLNTLGGDNPDTPIFQILCPRCGRIFNILIYERTKQ